MMRSIFIMIVVTVFCHLYYPCFSFTPKLAITMMCRDEEVNLKSNLRHWLYVVDYFVFLVDNRTVDNTIQTIRDILIDNNIFRIIMYDFDGFGNARTLSLSETWEHFPQATHVLIADPDWLPDTKTMKKSDLDLSAEVFRFISYDRNGVTTRRMDWLLKHRKGLRMRYNLHEVLDIGMYTVKNIPWVIHEIEKAGSWHTTVGHGHSMSYQRYEFDLALLEKDLTVYGHDPHTHYYLGITYYALAEKLLENANLNGSKSSASPIISKYLDHTIKNLEIRALSKYNDEFMEERWSVMYLLGTLYWSFIERKEFSKSHYWFSMCRDFNPQQSECSIGLVKLYYSIGEWANAWKEIEKLIKVEQKEREMLNHYRLLQCDFPALFIEIFTLKSKSLQPSDNEIKYLLLIKNMMKNEICGDVYSDARFSQDFQYFFPTWMNQLKTNGNTIDKDSSENDLCNDQNLINYIMGNEINLHPCNNIRDIIFTTKECGMFQMNVAPAYEDLQISNRIKSFIGTANPIDLVHHVYNGGFHHIFTDEIPYRVLFAEYFTNEMIYGFIGGMATLDFKSYEIYVLSPNDAIEQDIRGHIQYCSAVAKFNKMLSIFFIKQTLDSYITKRASNDAISFDYIEYNGGLSISPSYKSHLNYFSKILSDRGVIGLTYFPSNIHVDNLRNIMKSRNISAHIPFSFDISNAIKEYLALYDMEFLIKDKQILTLLGGDLYNTPFPFLKESDILPPQHWTTFKQSEVINILNQYSFSLISWIPTAYSNPYTEINDYDVRKYESYGVSAEEFSQKIMTTMRLSTYIVNSKMKNKFEISQNCRLGRPDLSVQLLNSDGTMNRIIVMDRIGTLNQIFSTALTNALSKTATPVEFAHYIFKKKFRLRYIVLPEIAASLSILSNTPTIQDMHDANKKFCAKNIPDIDDEVLLSLLLSALQFFEKTNVITFWSKGGCINNFPPIITTETKPMNIADGIINKDVKSETLSRNGNRDDNDLVKVGGLNINFKSPTKKIVIDLTNQDGPSTMNSATVKQELSARKQDFVAKKETKPFEKMNTDSKSSDLSKQAQRMRELGFPEDLITETLSIPSDMKNSKNQGQVKLSNDDRITNDIKDRENIPEESEKNTVEKSVKPFIKEVNQDVEEQDSEQDIKERLNGILNLLKKDSDTSNGKRNEEVMMQTKDILNMLNHDANMNAKSVGVKKKLESMIELLNTNILQKEKPTMKEIKSNLHGIITNEQTHVSTVQTTQNSNSEFEMKMYADARKVKFPKQQTQQELQSSFRNIDCFNKNINNNNNNNNNNNCGQPAPIKRRTSSLMSTNLRKLEFDLNQLRYIVSKISNQQERNNISESLYSNIETVYRSISDINTSKMDKVVRVDLRDLKLSQLAINRAINVVNYDIDFESFVHIGAIKHIQTMSNELFVNDFIVVDIILKQIVMKSLSNMLLSSTIWFDTTNGNAFVSHFDDGLIQQAFAHLSQQIAYALSVDKAKLSVLKFYSIIMSLKEDGVSPLSMSNKDEITVVIWLNPIDGDDVESETDGLVIYDEFAAGQLFSQGISVYPSVHSDFLSRSGDLYIDARVRCTGSSSELVPRVANRMVVIKSRKPFMFVNEVKQKSEISEEFDKSHMIALVIVLSTN